MLFLKVLYFNKWSTKAVQLFLNGKNRKCIFNGLSFTNTIIIDIDNLEIFDNFKNNYRGSHDKGHYMCWSDFFFFFVFSLGVFPLALIITKINYGWPDGRLFS